MKANLTIRKDKNFLILDDWKDGNDKYYINTEKNSADRRLMKIWKRESRIYIGSNKEVMGYYKEIK